MIEPERIKTRLRSAATLKELASVWRAEQKAINDLDKTMKIQVVNLKDVLKDQFLKG